MESGSLLDAEDRVIHSHEGQMEQADIEQFIKLIKEQLDQADAA